MAVPRILPLTDDEQTDDQRAMINSTRLPGVPASNIFRTLARHPGLFRHWLPFAGKLLTGGKLSGRDRELVVLRTGLLCNSEYEWAQHALIGRQAGLTDEEIERVRLGPDAPGWSPAEAALLRTADELHDTSTITDDTWAALAAHYDEKQLIELTMLVGQYHMVAFAANALGVQLEPEFEVGVR